MNITNLICWILLASNIIAAQSSTTDEPRSPKQASKDTTIDLGVIDLTSKNFGTTVGMADGKVWLIEFYTQGCVHCRNFASSYESIAKTFHSNPDEKIRVARVDCGVEKALLTRFGVKAFPSFFLVSGWDVYEFEDSRTTANLINFARTGHKKNKPIPFLNSPMGPMGLLQGTLIFAGTRAMGILEYLQESYGISPLISGVVICMLGVFGGMISIIMLTIFSTPRGGGGGGVKYD
mmetsp:Transcript_16535/g.18244  ORF Transcript_16535/g.18244 Transcript_16535/m.18244 type:complete len:235 (+) Transcript_16535:103-807(+)